MHKIMVGLATMKLNTVKITIKKVLNNGDVLSIRSGGKRRFLSFVEANNWKNLSVYVEYPNGLHNEYEGTDKTEARQTLLAFLE